MKLVNNFTIVVCSWLLSSCNSLFATNTNIHIQNGERCLTQYKYDSVLYYCNVALAPPFTITTTEQAEVYLLQVKTYNETNNAIKLFSVAPKLLRIAAKESNTSYAIQAYLYLALTNYRLNKYSELMRYLNLCSTNNQYRKTLKATPELLLLYYSTYAFLYEYKEDYKKIKLYNALAIDVCEKNKNLLSLVKMQLSAAFINEQSKDSIVALGYLLLAKKNSLLTSDSILYDSVNLAYCDYLLKHNNSQDLQLLQSVKQSLAYNKRHKKRNSILLALIILADSYDAQKQYGKAQMYWNDFLTYKSPIAITQKVYDYKYQIALLQHDYCNAITYLDSATSIEKRINIDLQEANIKSALEKKQLQQKTLIKQLASEQQLSRSKYIGVITTLVLALVLTIVVLFYSKRYTNQKLQHATLHQQLLRSQMNPHFMFNSLNALHYYILDNEKNKAAKYLSKLSSLVRNSLNQSFNEKISLSDEVKHLTQYMELECYRYIDKNFYEITIADTLDAERVKIPHMLLQPFVENAFNHGLKHKTDNGKVTVTIAPHTTNAIVCTITDDGLGRSAVQQFNSLRNHDSKALTIITERMALLNKFDKPNVRYTYSITDLYNPNNQPAGTAITLIIPYD